MGSDRSAVVLVGAGVADQKQDDPADAVEAIELMHRAVADAADDAGSRALTGHVTWIGVPEGTWGYRDPGALLAERLARPRADVHTVVADVGILQQDLITRAIDAVAGGAKVALVVGGEAKHRQLRGVITGVATPETVQGDDVVPDERLAPGSMAALGVHDLEIIRNTVTPVAAYALIENAIGHASGRTLDEHREHVAQLWARFAAVAATNPHAWDRSAPAAPAIRDPGDGNRMISFPYTKRHSAQWNVDQAAALFLCTVETARAMGISDDRWVFPHAAAVSNHPVPVSQRAAVHRSPGAEVAAPKALELAGITTDDLTHVDLYSCFPSAVEVFAGALALPLDDAARPLTVTGGLTFAGGPLNNYVLQALVELARRLRHDAVAGAFGLSSSVSGFLVKQGFGLWSTSAPARGFRSIDVSAEAAERAGPEKVLDADARGAATIATYTVDFADGRPARSVVLADVDADAGDGDGARTIAESRDPSVAEALMARDPIGRRAVVDGGAFRLE
jgi:acetyl-CoA C-acetyltransferase